MKLNQVHRQAMDDARRYPPCLIIAQRMILDGFTYETAHKVLATSHDPLHGNTLNSIRDIERGQLLTGQDPERIKALAKALFTDIV
jgi:hypothetical protein